MKARMSLSGSFMCPKKRLSLLCPFVFLSLSGKVCTVSGIQLCRQKCITFTIQKLQRKANRQISHFHSYHHYYHPQQHSHQEWCRQGTCRIIRHNLCIQLWPVIYKRKSSQKKKHCFFLALSFISFSRKLLCLCSLMETYKNIRLFPKITFTLAQQVNK